MQCKNVLTFKIIHNNPSDTSVTEIKYDFSIGSLNVRGINEDKKRTSVFKWAKDKKFDIIFLQECYCSPEIEQKWRMEWDGQIIFSHGSKHSKGVMVMFRKNLDVKLLDQKIDLNGRYIICKLELQGTLFSCVNLYAPNTMQNKQIFFNDISQAFEDLNILPNEKLIIAGDWNSIQDIEWDKKGGNLKAIETVTESMKELIGNFELIDIWRLMHPETKRYTYRQKNPIIQSRLDYFYITNEVQDYVYKTDIIPSVWSDHSCITIYIKHLTERERGNGHWKFNSSLLKDAKYTKDMEENLTKWINDFNVMENKHIAWELLKYHIRKFTITFSSIKKWTELNGKLTWKSNSNSLRAN